MFQFGLQLLVQFSSDRVSAQDFFQNMIKQISVAEKYNFDSVWMGEHHVIGSARFPPIATLSAVASITKRVKIGQSVLLLPLYHPMHVAEDLAMIDVISNGRLILGVASGYRREEYSAFGVPINERGGRLEEGIEIIKQLWTKRDVSYNGKYYSLNHAWIDPRPVQKPRPPIFIGASTDAAVRRAARVGDGWLMQGSLPTETLRTQLKIFDEAVKLGNDASADEIANKENASNKIEKSIGLVTECCIANNRDETEDCTSSILSKFKENVRWGENWFGSASNTDEIKERYIIGNPDECINQIEAKHKEFRVTNFVLRFQLPGVNDLKATERIKLFGERVISYFRDNRNS